MLEDVLYKWGASEVSAMDVYKDVFRLGTNEIQNNGEPSGEFKANPIGYWKNKNADKGHFRIFFDDTFEETLEELQKADFAILNGLTYFGRRNSQKHASKMFSMIFDIDGVTDKSLNNLLNAAFEADVYPIPNFVVLSGHGVHLYYVFENPVPLFPNLKIQLKELKFALTDLLWNQYTSTEKNKQFQGIGQGFRVIGGRTKEDAVFPKTRVFRLNMHPFSLEQLNRYVPKEHRVDESKLWRESKLTLEQAKQKYPQWYQKVIVNGDKTPKRWDIAGKVNGKDPYALYHWWLNRIQTEATFGHRYFAVMCLAIYGAKCDVPYEQVKKDAFEVMPILNALNPEEPFTETDVNSALECYDYKYCTFPRDDIAKLSNIPIEANKRNYRKQADHIKLMNFIRDEINHNTEWRNGNGRKPKQEIVAAWRKNNPDGRKADCIRETGLSKATVYKWWE